MLALRNALRRRATPLLGSTYARALRRALDAGGLDSAAALTYYALLSLVPCATLLLAVIGLIGRDPETTNSFLELIAQGGSTNAAEAMRTGLTKALDSEPTAGTAFGIGLVGSVYVSSLYVSAFARAAQALAGGSRRSSLRRKPLQALATLAGVLVLALALVLIVLSRRLADALADVTGVGLFAHDLWPALKWAGILACLLAIVSALYALDPSRRRRWLPRPSRGSLIAVGLWALATLGFEVYLHTLASYDQTYGALGGLISFLVWAWLSNIVLLYGLSLDQERRAEARGA